MKFNPFKKILAAILAFAMVIPALSLTELTAVKVSANEYVSDYSENTVADSIMAIATQNNKDNAKFMSLANYLMKKSKYRLAYLGGEYFPYDNNSKDWVTEVTDGKYTRTIGGSKGCMAYCNWVSEIFYNVDIGATTLDFPGTAGNYSATEIASFIQKQLQVGEQIRITDRHSLFFVSATTKGLYYVSYRSNGSALDLIYSSYEEFADWLNAYGVKTFVYNANPNKNGKPTANTRSNLKLKNTAEGITLSWTKVKCAKGYQIYRKESGGSYELVTTIADYNTKTYTDTTVDSGVKYTYRICAYYEKYHSEYSTLSQTYYSEPTITKVKVEEGQITLRYLESEGATMYRILRSTNAGKYKTIAKTEDLTYTDTNVTEGETYSYMVKAISENGTALSSAATQDNAVTYFAVPVLNKISNKTKGVKITWTANENAGNFVILRKNADGSTGWEQVGRTTTTSFTDKTAEAWTEYIYTVKITDETGKIAYSGYDKTGLSITRY